MKKKHDPSVFQGRSKEKYENNGKILMWSISLMIIFLLVYGFINYFTHTI